MDAENIRVLVVCGASGTGKTVTLWEIGHNLQQRGVRHALIDTDELDRFWPQPEPVEALISISRRHLQAMWQTYSGLGVRHLVLCGVMASITQSESWIANAIPGATITFVRLKAERLSREGRLRGRELGSGFEHDMAASDRATRLIEEHDEPTVPVVVTDGKAVAEVAAEVLVAGSWTDPTHDGPHRPIEASLNSMEYSPDDLAEVAPLVRRLYEIVDELERLFPGRSFTPDGHLVGSIGESLAAYMFDLDLMPASFRGSDAMARDGSTVEIKATQGSSVALSAHADPLPDRLVVLRLLRTGQAEVIYNGPAAQAWSASGAPQRNGQRRIGFGVLRALPVRTEDQLPLIRDLG